MDSCALCGAPAQYRDQATGQYLCLEHARLDVTAPGRRESSSPLQAREAMASDYRRIEELTLYFWDETILDCFDRQYDTIACPAFVACDGDDLVGVASIAEEQAWSALVLVQLGVLPRWQGRGGGRALLDAVRQEALARGLAWVLVATTNDDLPALSLYQRYGFCIREVLPGRVAEDHAAEGRTGGNPLRGFAGIPVRDEIRLEFSLSAPGK